MKRFLDKIFIKLSLFFLICSLNISCVPFFNNKVTLDEITITSEPTKTDYYVGDEFDSTGMVVIAKYSDESTKDVTGEVSIKGFDSSEIKLLQTITVSYTEDGNTKTDSFCISINEKPKEAKYEITYNNVYTWTNSIGTSWAQVIIEIENTGDVPLYLSSGSFDLETPSGIVVKTSSLVSEYPDVIEVGEKGYFYDAVMLDEVPTENLVVIPRISAKEAKVPCTRFEVTQVTISDSQYYGPKAIGKIKNNTTSDCTSIIYIVVILYNAENKPIGILKDLITDDLPAGASIGYEATNIYNPDSLYASDVNSYLVYAYPNQYQFN